MTQQSERSEYYLIEYVFHIEQMYDIINFALHLFVIFTSLILSLQSLYSFF